MLLNLDPLQSPIGIRAVAADRVVLSSGESCCHSFLLDRAQGLRAWSIDAGRELRPDDLLPLLASQPTLILLGTGDQQIFPAPAVLATALTQGVGLEVMNNAAAARTFNVLLSEGREVLLAMRLRGN